MVSAVVVVVLVSVVAGNFVYGFRRWFFMVSVVAGKHFLWFPFLQQQARAEAGRGWDATDSPQIHDRAGDARARSHSGIVMRSPAAKDPDLTSGLHGLSPGCARFQGNCICLFVACLLLACFLLLLVVCLFLLFPSRAGGQS